MRILFISMLYPSSAEPTRAAFNRSLLCALRQSGDDVRVIAPVPWFPLEPWLRGLVLPPLAEELDGIPILHPRFLRSPGLCIHWHHVAYRRRVGPLLARMLLSDTGPERRPAPWPSPAPWVPDHVILGFAYPDAAAMAPECVALGIPHSVRVNGSDFRLRIRQRRFGRIVLRTLRQAPLVLCPGHALRRDMIGAGLDPARIVAFDNGVDPRRFHAGQAGGPGVPRGVAPGRALGASGGEPATEEPLPAATGRDVAGVRTVLFVGNLVAVKGADRLLSAFARLRTQARLVIIGDGPCRRRLVALARDLGVAATVRFLGCQSQPEVAEWMRRSDCLCLPSRSEGMPNVVVEALACGTPVVATDVGEVPFLVQDGVNGFVLRASLTEGDRRVEEEVAAGLAAALDQVLERDWDRQAISSRLQGYTWERAAAVVAGAVRTVTPPRPGAEPRQQMPCSEPSTSG